LLVNSLNFPLLMDVLSLMRQAECHLCNFLSIIVLLVEHSC